MKTLTTLAAALVTIASLAAASAQPVSRADAGANASAPASSFHADAEVDPTAYVLDGYSVHVGIGYRRLRVDLGAYAMKLPKAVHGHDDLELSFDGYGIKAQYFLFAEQRGGFVGIDGGVTRATVAKPDMQLAERNTELGIGVNAGWRFAITDAFYATTWLGVSYDFNPHTVMLGTSKYEGSHITVFPAVHLGYRFR